LVHAGDRREVFPLRLASVLVAESPRQEGPVRGIHPRTVGPRAERGSR